MIELLGFIWLKSNVCKVVFGLRRAVAPPTVLTPL